MGMTGHAAVACGALLVTVFTASGVGKLRDPAGFAVSIGALGLFSARSSALVARALTEAELLVVLVLGSSLVLGARYAVVGFAFGAVLTAAFCVVVAIVVKRGIRARCHCFGRASAEYSARHVARNALLVAVALTGAGASLAPSAVPLPEAVIAASAGLVLGLLMIAMDDLIALFGSEPRSRRSSSASRAVR